MNIKSYCNRSVQMIAKIDKTFAEIILDTTSTVRHQSTYSVSLSWIYILYLYPRRWRLLSSFRRSLKTGKGKQFWGENSKESEIKTITINIMETKITAQTVEMTITEPMWSCLIRCQIWLPILLNSLSMNSSIWLFG